MTGRLAERRRLRMLNRAELRYEGRPRYLTLVMT